MADKSELVALNTQELTEPLASRYLDVLARVLRSARLSSAYPDRKRVSNTLRALSAQTHGGLYNSIYVDSRSGLPNLASLTRVVTDHELAVEGRTSNNPVKRAYREVLRKLVPAPVDEHRVVLRRHDAARSRAEVRFELIKLAGSGLYTKVTVDLIQTGGMWSHELVRVDAEREVVAATAGLRTTVYKLATYDAETLFARLQKLDGVEVQRVERGIMGPVLFALGHDDGVVCPLQPAPTPLATAWAADISAKPPDGLEMVATFATDLAGVDVKQDRSNDPLEGLLGDAIAADKQVRYAELRREHSFRVYKDRKFVVTGRFKELVQGVCDRAGTRNLIYPLR
jgi:hypothetical protein